MIHVLEVENSSVVEVLTREQSLIEFGRVNVGERTGRVGKETKKGSAPLDAS